MSQAGTAITTRRKSARANINRASANWSTSRSWSGDAESRPFERAFAVGGLGRSFASAMGRSSASPTCPTNVPSAASTVVPGEAKGLILGCYWALPAVRPADLSTGSHRRRDIRRKSLGERAAPRGAADCRVRDVLRVSATVIALAAALSASIVFGGPVTVGHAGSRSETLGAMAQPDPVQGGWIQFSDAAGRQLARVSESGGVTAVSLPPQLDGEARSSTLELTPLKSGWIIAVNTVFPDGKVEEAQCLEARIPSPTCGQLAVAERSPSGRWTPVQRLPRARGFEASAVEA